MPLLPFGSRKVRAADFFTGLFTTTLEVGELLTEVTIPKRPARSAYAFQEIARRHGDYALAGAAAAVAVDERGEVFAFVAWDADTGEVVRLFTHPRGWGYGAGQALLEAACTALRSAGCKQAWLWTEERNDAVGFYEHAGFRREGEPRIRDWHGARICEPRFARDL